MTGPVLCAVDLAEPADGAIRFSALLAGIMGAPLTVLHVREPGEESGAAARLDALARGLAKTGLVTAAESSDGDPAGAIVRRARALDASVVVMGTHGGSGVERLMLGSVAETVLHRAGRPVATLRGPAHAGGPVRKIVCGADLADRAPLEWAAALARRTGAELVVVHAVPDLAPEGSRNLMPAAWCASLLEEARAGVAQTIASLDAPGVSVRGLAVPGPVARTLLARAAAEDADVLVVGVHPHVLGSTTHPVVRGAACPVVTIPPTSAGRDNS